MYAHAASVRPELCSTTAFSNTCATASRRWGLRITSGELIGPSGMMWSGACSAACSPRLCRSAAVRGGGAAAGRSGGTPGLHAAATPAAPPAVSLLVGVVPPGPVFLLMVATFLACGRAVPSALGSPKVSVPSPSTPHPGPSLPFFCVCPCRTSLPLWAALVRLALRRCLCPSAALRQLPFTFGASSLGAMLLLVTQAPFTFPRSQTTYAPPPLRSRHALALCSPPRPLRPLNLRPGHPRRLHPPRHLPLRRDAEVVEGLVGGQLRDGRLLQLLL